MDIKKRASAGTLQSNDCIVTVTPSDELYISVKSILFKECGKDIEKTVLNTLKSLGIDKINLEIDDKGALDETIIYRIKKAVERAL